MLRDHQISTRLANDVLGHCSELERIDRFIFDTCGIKLENIQEELDSKKYFAHTFKLKNKNVKFRIAKITPTKTGQFVTIWKRNKKGITEPFDISDDIDFCIIAARNETHFGFFVFPKTILHEKKILSDKNQAGKRGIRVYPSWDLATNKQAQETQSWQGKYFLEISKSQLIAPKIVNVIHGATTHLNLSSSNLLFQLVC